MAGEMLKGHLEMVVLAALSTGPAHGYAVIQQIRKRSGGEFDLPKARSTQHCIVSSRQVC